MTDQYMKDLFDQMRQWRDGDGKTRLPDNGSHRPLVPIDVYNSLHKCSYCLRPMDPMQGSRRIGDKVYCMTCAEDKERPEVVA